MPVVPLLAAIVGGLVYAVLGYAYKLAGERGIRKLAFLTAYGLIAGVLMLATTAFQTTAWGDWRLWALAAVSGADFVCVIALILGANELGPASVVWTICNLALLIPVLVSPMLFNEPLHRADVLLFALFAGMLYAFARGVAGTQEVQPKGSTRFAMAVGAMFVTNGLFMVLTKYKDHLFNGANSGAFGALMFLSASCIACVLHLATGKQRALRRSEWVAGLRCAVACATGFTLLLAAMGLPAVVVFPLNQSISLLGGVVLTAVIFRERLNVPKAVGFGLGLALMAVSVFRDALARWLG